MMSAPARPPEVRVYRTRHCPYCTLATRLLSSLGVAFREIDVSGDLERRRWLVQASGQRTVPQIFVGERSIGGYRELRQLLRGGTAALYALPARDVAVNEADSEPEETD